MSRSSRAKPARVRPAGAGGLDGEGRRGAHRDHAPRSRPPTPSARSRSDARPLTNRPRSAAGSAPSSSRRPTTLSTALCRPMSSRTTSTSRRRGRRRRRRARRRCASNSSCVGRARGRATAASDVERRTARPAAAGASRAAQVVERRRAAQPARRGRGASAGRRASGARPPVSTVTTLNSVSTAEPGRAVAARRAPAAPAEEPVGEAEAGGQLEVVARRAHRGGDERGRRGGSRAAPRR